MSMKLTALAMDVRVGSALRKLVLLKLCDNANDQGECWPSFKHIADQCEITRRSVINHVRALQDAGFLKVVHRGQGGNQSSNRYRIDLAPKPPEKAVDNSPNEPRPSERDSPPLVKEIHHPSEIDSPPPSERDSPGTSHSFEPVTEPEKKPGKKNPPSSARGCRLPDDWVLPDRWRAEAEQIAPELAGRLDAVAAKFRDYWVGLAGQRAVKRDWLATWRNWVRNERGRWPGGGPPAGPPGQGRPGFDPNATRNRSLLQDLTDTSWADDEPEARSGGGHA